jgi:multidrug resistance efflux pump
MTDQPDKSLHTLLRRMSKLREFSGEPPQFWKEYLETLSLMVQADCAFLLRSEGEKGSVTWKQLLVLPSARSAPPELVGELAGIASAASESGHVIRHVDYGGGGGGFGVGVKLSAGDGLDAVAVLGLSGVSEEEAERRVSWVSLVSDIALDYQRQRSWAQAENEVESCRGVLEALVSVYKQERFVAACLTLCDELAGRLECEQVGLGVLVNNEYVRLKAMSQTSRFDKKAGVVRSLETSMEEAVDQDEEILWPVPEGMTAVTRSHEQYARERGIDFLCTVPVHHSNRVVGAICCERKIRLFSESEVRQISLLGELISGRLMDLQDRDKWLVLRLLDKCREKLSGFLGVERTWLKATALFIFLAFLILFCVPARYRVDASFILKASRMAHMSAPFEGVVDEVTFEIGDRVEKGKELVALDRRALLLDRVSAAADLQRFRRDAEKKRAEGRLADMRISEALAEQAQAALDLIDYRLESSVISAPFDGVVVEGEWKDKIHSPVRQGDILAKVAQLDSMFIELKIDSAEIARIKEDATGEIAFLSDPATKYPMQLVRINPAASALGTEPVFMAKAEFATELRDWWRPGMSGVAKINVGWRSLWWIFTHRTSDFLRRQLWW